jgi:hypothetical protein
VRRRGLVLATHVAPTSGAMLQVTFSRCGHTDDTFPAGEGDGTRYCLGCVGVGHLLQLRGGRKFSGVLHMVQLRESNMTLAESSRTASLRRQSDNDDSFSTPLLPRHPVVCSFSSSRVGPLPGKRVSPQPGAPSEGFVVVYPIHLRQLISKHSVRVKTVIPPSGPKATKSIQHGLTYFAGTITCQRL